MGIIYKNGTYYGGGSGGGGATYTAGDGINIDENNEISTNNMSAEDMSEVASPMPSVMSRRFKYSTEEQIVGEWIDGKPIYQKTITATSCSAGYNYITHGLTNAKIVNGWGVYMELNGEGNPLPMLGSSPSSIDVPYSVLLSHISGGRLEFLVGANRSGGDIYYTLQYTKTTD